MKKVLLFFACAIFVVNVAIAQEVSEKKEIAVFGLSYSGWSVPSGALSLVDQQIIEVFTGLGRFDVKGLDLRLRTSDISEFTGLIRDIKESNMAVDEKFRLGEETFTEADFERLTGSFIIVIPSLTFYESFVTDSEDGPEWEVELQTAFSFIRVSDSGTIADFSITTYGSGKTQQRATMDAAEAISSQLEFELRSIEEFRIRTGIIEVLPGSRVVLELGSNMGISVGDEFSIINSRILGSGHTVVDNTGLLVIRDVKNEISYGHVIYNSGKVFPGDQLSEVPRFGTDFSVYARGFFDTESLTGGTAGIKTVLSRGVFGLRPLIGFEIPLVAGTLNNIWPGLPLTVYGGGELFWYLGRLQIEPSITFGVTGLVPIQDTDSFLITHIGGAAALTVNWMLSDGFRVFIEGGYSPWFSIAPSRLNIIADFGGIFGGAGVTFKI